MRKVTIAATLSALISGVAGTAVFAAHDNQPAADGMANMDGMTGMEDMAAGGGAMPMAGMMPMMMGMMPMMAMMPMMPMGGQSMMPMGGQSMTPTGGQSMTPTGGQQPMAGMDGTAPAPEAVPAGLEAKLDLLINSIDSLTARIERLEAPAAN